MNLTPYQVIDTIIVTEKSTAAQDQGKYTFRVHPTANKVQIRQAVEAIYPEVKVKSVNVMNYTGKLRRAGKTQKMGSRPDWKKAVVTLKTGAIELM